jgi:hypothetical protein
MNQGGVEGNVDSIGEDDFKDVEMLPIWWEAAG